MEVSLNVLSSASDVLCVKILVRFVVVVWYKKKYENFKRKVSDVIFNKIIKVK